MIELEKSVVAVDCGSYNASGVVVGPGLVITAYHLVEEAPLAPGPHPVPAEGFLSVKYHNKTYKAHFVRAEESHDLCLLKIDDKDFDALPVPLAAKAPDIGDPVTVMGYDVNMSPKIYEGQVDHLNQGDNEPIVISSVVIEPGLCGGGLFNADGELIGINALAMNTRAASGHVPVAWVKSLLARSDSRTTLYPEGETEIDRFYSLMGGRESGRCASMNDLYRAMAWVNKRPDSFIAADFAAHFIGDARYIPDLCGENLRERLERRADEIYDPGCTEKPGYVAIVKDNANSRARRRLRKEDRQEGSDTLRR